METALSARIIVKISFFFQYATLPLFTDTFEGADKH